MPIGRPPCDCSVIVDLKIVFFFKKIKSKPFIYLRPAASLSSNLEPGCFEVPLNLKALKKLQKLEITKFKVSN